MRRGELHYNHQALLHLPLTDITVWTHKKVTGPVKPAKDMSLMVTKASLEADLGELSPYSILRDALIRFGQTASREDVYRDSTKQQHEVLQNVTTDLRACFNATKTMPGGTEDRVATVKVFDLMEIPLLIEKVLAMPHLTDLEKYLHRVCNTSISWLKAFRELLNDAVLDAYYADDGGCIPDPVAEVVEETPDTAKTLNKLHKCADEDDFDWSKHLQPWNTNSDDPDKLIIPPEGGLLGSNEDRFDFPIVCDAKFHYRYTYHVDGAHLKPYVAQLRRGLPPNAELSVDTNHLDLNINIETLIEDVVASTELDHEMECHNVTATCVARASRLADQIHCNVRQMFKQEVLMQEAMKHGQGAD